MADTGIFASTAEVIRKAGAGASTDATTETAINDFMTQVESWINSESRYNWSDNYATLNADTRGLLKMAASNFAAIHVIAYDMSGYTDRIEAEDLININRDAGKAALRLLKDKKTVEFIKETT